MGSLNSGAGKLYLKQRPDVSIETVCGKAEQFPGQFVCSRCGAELVKPANVYCSECIASWQFDFKQKSRECQDRVDEMQAKLLLKGSAETVLLEALKQKELLIMELQHKIKMLTLVETGGYIES